MFFLHLEFASDHLRPCAVYQIIPSHLTPNRARYQPPG